MLNPCHPNNIIQYQISWFIAPRVILPFYVGCIPQLQLLSCYFVLHNPIVLSLSLQNHDPFQHFTILQLCWFLLCCFSSFVCPKLSLEALESTFKWKLRRMHVNVCAMLAYLKKYVCYLSYLQHSLWHLFCLEKDTSLWHFIIKEWGPLQGKYSLI